MLNVLMKIISITIGSGGSGGMLSMIDLLDTKLPLTQF